MPPILRKRTTRSQSNSADLEALPLKSVRRPAKRSRTQKQRHKSPPIENTLSSTPHTTDDAPHPTDDFKHQDENTMTDETNLPPARPWEITTIEDDENPVFDILDALLELPHVEDLPTQTFPKDQAAALDALELNEQMQSLVEKQIEKINKQIAFTEDLVKETRTLSIREARIQRQKMDINRLYSDYFDFFEETEQTEPFSEEDDQVILDSERIRTWTPKDRQQLSAGIHSEVQRMVAFDHVSRNEAWRVWEVDNIPKSVWENYPVDKLDWNRISNLYVKTRSPMECMIQWTTQDHPTINKSPWKREESEQLAGLVETLGYHGTWERIASELKTDRTAAQCFAHYQAKYRDPDPKRPWTKQEDQELKDAVMLVGDKNWQLVAVSLGERSGQQCLHRWRCINPAIRRSRWMEEEDAALKGAVAVYGSGNWSQIQRHIPGRTDTQCRERWMNVLDPSLVHTQFSDEEQAKLRQLVKDHGRKWSLIAEQMPGRTDNHCLRQWTKLERLDKRAQQKQSS